ncbi:hypothetical protein OG723_43935 (plasmid) [Streptomyces sp. NBC_01278]|uniref:hypothetical protein n=1 Tax=unclassified Streptomyces TaxID=2593676 RepID=UPI002E34F19C|nr:hypothetical protein [Streptomyces sp. NBC_01278]
MTDAANTPPTTRAARVLTTVAVVLGFAYIGLMTFISVPQLTDYIGGRDIDFPVFLAIAAVAGPALFWAYIGLGFGLTVVGWAAGIALTGILTSLTYGYLLASSDGHGFSYWLFLTLIVAVTLGAFCVMPYALVRGTIRSR